MEKNWKLIKPAYGFIVSDTLEAGWYRIASSTFAVAKRSTTTEKKLLYHLLALFALGAEIIVA